MKSKLLLLPVLLAGLLASCGNQPGPGPNPDPDPVVHVESITLNSDRVIMTVGKTYSIAASVLPANATDKSFTWSSTDETVAKYEAGKIHGYKPGEVTITVTTTDLHITDTCLVTVEEDTDIHVETINFETPEVDLYVGATYSQMPLITPDDATCKDVEWSSSLTTVATVSNTGLVTAKKAGTTVITAKTEDGGKEATYKVNVSEEPIKVSTIKEVKDYIAAHPVTVNSHKCGVNKDVSFTIAGFAIAKFDLIKTKKSFGLDVSYPGKTIIADETGYIACASLTTKGSNSLYEKVADHQCKDTSRYTVKGYISTYLDQPELVVESFVWDEKLDVKWNADKLIKKEVTISDFFDEAASVYYNCAGHGYGEIYSLKGLTCFSMESNGSGVRYYHFTDGTHQLRVNAFNISQCSVGYAYDIIGITSLKNYSAIIVGLKIKSSSSEPVELDYESVATEQTIDNLRKNKTNQDDTDTKYPTYIKSWKNVYKATGYLTSCIQDGKYYLGIRDTYYTGKDEIEGKDNARSTYKMALIKNDNFWNCTWEQYERFNPYGEYINVNTPCTFYYVQELMGYKSGETLWDIMLIPSSLPELVA